ncbi:TetR/AcrR family transcriptional regulator [Pseudonocardia acaciae]|uniref:TetR/AcrR family transcriptional regulator n=1 Tax=Pseudonocardia acaciae TaxID=551276 RepID=UPI000688AB49|nr:TetR/AcrR family transcriptional regulator [Pseudonocardia acaciae]
MSTTKSRRPLARRSRREEYSESTRAALVTSAIELFAERGYAETSLDAIASAARVTKGALYHHFPGGKKALFAAAFDQIEEDVHVRLVEAARAEADSPWEAGMASLRAFLDFCLEPTYRRIVWQEGPHVMGFAAWWECEERYSLGLIAAILEKLMDAGQIERLPIDPLARTISGALAGAATAMSVAVDPQRVRAEFEQVIARLMQGLRPLGSCSESAQREPLGPGGG